ncbi:MAG: hypothetical protein GY754_22935 [bacterium]|nr:hypothetical protein [bacterium]
MKFYTNNRETRLFGLLIVLLALLISISAAPVSSLAKIEATVAKYNEVDAKPAAVEKDDAVDAKPATVEIDDEIDAEPAAIEKDVEVGAEPAPVEKDDAVDAKPAPVEKDVELEAEPAEAAADAEDEDEDEEEDEEDDEDDEDDEDEEITFDYVGALSFENLIDLNSNQKFSGIFKKNEIRHNMKIQYGTENIYVKLNSNFYVTPYVFSNSVNSEYLYSEETRLAHNLRLSGKGAEINFRELFFNYAAADSFIRIRAGNQVYGWGSADIFNPTSYFNRLDLREIIFKDEDELGQGVPSISTLILADSFSVELVCVPFQLPILLAAPGNFWEIQYRPGPFKVVIDNEDYIDPALSFGGKFATSFMKADLSLSYYNGLDNEAVLRPYKVVLEDGEPVTIVARDEYYRVNKLGFAATRPFGKLTLQGETAVTFDKCVLKEQSYSLDTEFPYAVQRSPFISYSLGFNYSISYHDGDTLLTMEWTQGRYFKGSIENPVFTDVLAVVLSDTFFDGSLKASFGMMFNLNAKIADAFELRVEGFALMPSIAYDFQNGVDCGLSFVYINGAQDSLLSYFDDYKILTLKVTYEY